MAIYVVRMYLTTNRPGSQGFDQRFSRATERRWRALVVEAASETDLETLLNKEIWDGCKTSMNSDIGTTTGVYAFDGSWGHGGGGLHESGLVQVQGIVGGVRQDWKFPESASYTYMKVRAEWTTVVPLVP